MKKNYLKIYYVMLDKYTNDLKIYQIYRKNKFACSVTTQKYYDDLINETRKYISAIKKAIKNQKLLDSVENYLYN